jgi:hypothetical protein
MQISPDLESKLALKNEAVQIQVCADYNFHSEESFKVNYWTRVLQTLAAFSENHLGGISFLSLKQWWVRQVSPRSLPGLRKVLFIAVQESKDLILLSDIKIRYNTHFNIPISPSDPQTRKQGLSIVGRLASSLWRIAVGGDTSDGEDSPRSQSSMIDENEVIFSDETLRKISKKILQILQQKAGLDGGPLESILIRESDVTAMIVEMLKNANIEMPFVAVAPLVVSMVIVWCLVDMWKAVPFTVNNFNCLKLPSVDSTDLPEPVTDRDRAYLMSAIASEKLMNQETSLTDQWNLIDGKVRDHLKAGRQPLALAALKERKLIEQRLEEIQIYKLKLAESSTLTQTAVIQQAVIAAINVGNQAAKTTFDQSVEDVEEIIEQADELRNQVKEISETITGGLTDIDDAVLLEYEQLVKEREENEEDEQKEAMMEMIDAIPSPPTAKVESPKLAVSSPKAIVPEEWFSDIQ